MIVTVVIIVVHPTVLRDVTTAASDCEAHDVEHAEVGERSGPNRYNSAQLALVKQKSPKHRTGLLRVTRFMR